MIVLVKQVLAAQFEASLCMFGDCLAKCPSEHWDGKVAKYPFWQVAYHTLCFVDLYLSENEFAFTCRPELHPAGVKDFEDEYPSRRIDQREIATYLAICRQKATDTIAAETAESLARPSGFHWLKFSRLEAHVYNIRHIQHHAGQMSAFLRRVDASLNPRWVGTGWK